MRWNLYAKTEESKEAPGVIFRKAHGSTRSMCAILFSATIHRTTVIKRSWRAPPTAPSESGPRSANSSTRSVRKARSEEHTSELQSRGHLVCRPLLEKEKD